MATTLSVTIQDDTIPPRIVAAIRGTYPSATQNLTDQQTWAWFCKSMCKDIVSRWESQSADTAAYNKAQADLANI